MSEPALNLPPNRVAPDRVCRFALELRARMRATMDRLDDMVDSLTERADDRSHQVSSGRPGPASA